MPSQFGGVEVAQPAAGGSQFGGIPVDTPAKPSIISDAVKYSPIGMIQGLASMLRTAAGYGDKPPGDAIADALKGNDVMRQRAVEAFKRGDYGQAAGHFLNYIAPGGAAMEDISQDVTDGNYGHAAAKFGGLASNALAPKILPAAGAAADAVSSAASKIPVKLPLIPSAITEAAGIVEPRIAHAAGLYNRGVRAFNAIRGATASPEATAAADEPAAEAIDAAHPLEPTAHPITPIPPDLTTPPFAQPRLAPQPGAQPGTWEPGPAGTPAPALHWEPASKTWEPGPPEAPAARSPESWEPYAAIDTAPDARASLPAELVAKVDAIRAATHDPLTAAQKIEDAGDEQAARLQGQAEEIIWRNRAAKADRFAAYLAQNKLDPTPENLATAARAMDERAAPSDETVPMIHDRMGYTAPAEAAPSELEQQLQGSLDLLGKSRAAFDAARPNGTSRPAPAVNPARPIIAMAPGYQMPAGSWVTPAGKVAELNRAIGETHVNALTRLLGKKPGDAFLHPLDNGWIRQSGDAVQLGDVSNPNLATAMSQAARTTEAANTGSIIVVHGGGNPIEVPVHLIHEFTRNPMRWVRRGGD